MDRRLRAPGIVLGVGLGGFVDGIVFHQILQWHHMLSSKDRSVKVNTLADGLFHAFAWLAVVVGLAMLYSRVRRGDGDRSWRSLWGWMIVGWGLFDLVEGLVDHEILRIHHVRSGPHHIIYDIAFLAFGALLVVLGVALLIGRDPSRRRRIRAPMQQ